MYRVDSSPSNVEVFEVRGSLLVVILACPLRSMVSDIWTCILKPHGKHTSSGEEKSLETTTAFDQPRMEAAADKVTNELIV